MPFNQMWQIQESLRLIEQTRRYIEKTNVEVARSKALIAESKVMLESLERGVFMAKIVLKERYFSRKLQR
jgi:hypothetical protein